MEPLRDKVRCFDERLAYLERYVVDQNMKFKESEYRNNNRMHALASKQELKNRELDLQRMVYDHRRAIDESNSHITGQFETMNTRIKHAFELMKSTTAAVDTAKTERLNLNREIDMYK